MQKHGGLLYPKKVKSRRFWVSESGPMKALKAPFSAFRLPSDPKKAGVSSSTEKEISRFSPGRRRIL